MTQNTINRKVNNVNDEIITITYDDTQLIGHGSFGTVFTTSIHETKENVAIKKVLQDKRFKNRELQIMKLLKHENVVNLKYFFYENNSDDDETYLNLIIEFMPMSLYQRLRHFVHLNQFIPLFEIKCYMYQIFKGLNYMHNFANVTHRDIKPQNILVNPETFELKICDLGSAKQLKPNEPNVSYICSRYYRAPELIFGSRNYTSGIDIWSTACVFAELTLNKPLFRAESNIDQLVEIIKLLGTPTKNDIMEMNPHYIDHKFPMIKSTPFNIAFIKKINDENIISILQDLLKYNPKERLTPLQCLQHSYFDELRLNRDKISNLNLFAFNDNEFKHLNDVELVSTKLKLL